MIEIVEYNEKYAESLSKIILSNLYTINIKDHGKDVIDKIATYFTTDAIREHFPKRTKCFVALQEEKVVGTASISKYRGDDKEDKYMIMTVFVDMSFHHQGIGKKLINKIEMYAKSISAKTLIIPASVYGLEFYLKLGYNYMNGIKEQNEEKEYMLEKQL